LWLEGECKFGRRSPRKFAYSIFVLYIISTHIDSLVSVNVILRYYFRSCLNSSGGAKFPYSTTISAYHATAKISC